jgi:head-tail adaptor
MAGGLLKHRIDVDRLALVSDGAGGHLENWSPLLTFYPAHVTPGGATSVERLVGDTRIEAPGVSEILIRKPAGLELRASDRVTYQGRVMQIRGLEDIDNGRRFLRLFCVEDVP